MKAAVVVFPGSNCDQDCYHVLGNVLGLETSYLWHRDRTIDKDVDCVCLPGGFTYGDYMRVGAIANHSPIMGAVKEFAAWGRLVIGICNGFQILTESGLLPGALMRNTGLRFICKTVPLRPASRKAPWTEFDQEVVRVPIAHGEGNYFTTSDGLKELQDNDQIAFRYCGADGAVNGDTNPNGSVDNIAGITNKAGNVLGMMPHPERCSEPELGNSDGLAIWKSMIGALS